VYASGVGKFINPNVKKDARKADGLSDNKIPTKKKKSASSFSDFSAW